MRLSRLPRIGAIVMLCGLTGAGSACAAVAAPAAADAAADTIADTVTADPLAAASARIAEASRRIAAAGEGLGRASATPDQVAALGAAIEAYNAALSLLRSGVADAAAREQAIGIDLSDRRAEISRLLAALETVSRTPRPAQAMHPLGPAGAARAAAMMAHLAPALQAEAARISDELANLRAARRLRIEGESSLDAGLATLAAAQSRLSDAIGRALPSEPGPDSPAATMLARDSANLTALAAALATSASTPPPADAAPTGRSPYVWPVAGTVLRRFNEPDAAGVRHPGIVLSAAPFALVAAPADAIVRYAGPFLEYGYVVVLEPDPRTMIVLAGLAQLRVATGTPVRRGELLGILGGRALDVEEYVMLPQSGTGAGALETLYIEVRRDRGPIDPEPLFARDNR